MAKAQLWHLARDGGSGSEYIVSEHPLGNRGKGRQIDWRPEGLHKWDFTPIDEETWDRLTLGDHVLEPGTNPRAVHLQLIVEEIEKSE